MRTWLLRAAGLPTVRFEKRRQLLEFVSGLDGAAWTVARRRPGLGSGVRRRCSDGPLTCRNRRVRMDATR